MPVVEATDMPAEIRRTMTWSNPKVANKVKVVLKAIDKFNSPKSCLSM